MQEILEKLEISRYEPEFIPELEKVFMDNLYNIDAATCLLKLYQLNPEKENIEIVHKILSLALPNTAEFWLCFMLVSAEIKTHQSLQVLIQINRLLEHCQFTDLWELMNNLPDTKISPEILNPKIRDYIKSLLLITYQSINKSDIKQFLSINDDELNKLIEENNWGSDQETIIFPKPTTKPQVKIDIGIDISRISTVFSKMD
ncbi:eukaryotic translation initiation factor 3 subunit k [Anaeramoeba ignava]|uniref:Eukaryotic translation initiation factor 3 subunit k n=1 Tax=Anaeramoeba ignava TaxID=1746090 RepID=A0A9Q0LTD0_ANAIG|nr:eukaryotic translation initiation factor 3 subunit k [Anaeramoeba ignava]